MTTFCGMIRSLDTDSEISFCADIPTLPSFPQESGCSFCNAPEWLTTYEEGGGLDVSTAFVNNYPSFWFKLNLFYQAFARVGRISYFRLAIYATTATTTAIIPPLLLLLL